jgi:transcription factor C subunit 3
MTEKQKLEALGLDETWTEYNILLIERPNPGVYVTPRGKRRPTGKRQGRPRISRIAVFKSLKLSSIPWFTEESEICDEDDGDQQTSREQTIERTPLPTSAAAVRISDIPSEYLDATPSRGAKRLPRQPASIIESSPVARRATKQRRITEFAADSEDLHMVDIEDRKGRQAEDLNSNRHDDDNDQNIPGKQLKRKRVDSPKPDPQDVAAPEEDSRESNGHLVQILETPSKKPREEIRNEGIEATSVATATAADDHSADKGPNIDIVVSAPNAEIGSTTQTGGALLIKTAEPQAIIENDQDQIGHSGPVERPDGANGLSREPSVSQTPIENGKATEVANKKKGSVGFIRRKIVMEIVEKAGGAFPLGAEIWYPFATAWRKTKYKETPDLRTIKSTAKHMVEAGKLRQLTFSGKDNKGVMVTKSIIIKPDMQPDDPLILDMQKKVLAAGSRHYIPANVDYDPEMTKSGSRRVTFGKEGRDPNTFSKLPVERGATVQLQHKPAFVLAQEKRRGLSIQRRLLQRIGVGQENQSRVVRLLSLQRPLAQDPSIPGMTSISRPDQVGESGRRRGKKGCRPSLRQAQDGSTIEGAYRMRRLWIPISSMAPYAMLMNPRQTFQTNNGTFSTDGGLAALRAARHAQKKKVRELPQAPETSGIKVPELPHSLDDLFSQTRRRPVDYSESVDPRSNRFFYDNNVILRWELQNEELLGGKSEDLLYINQTVQDSFDSAPIEGNIRFDVDEPKRLPLSPPEPRITRQRMRRSYLPIQPGTYGTPSSARTRTSATESSQNRRLERLNASMAASEVFETETQPTGSRTPIRRNRASYQLPHLLVQRIMTAIVVVRALAGGYEGKIVDWLLVSNSFPDHDPEFIQSKGKYILSKHRLQLAKMQSDFQDRFLEAYATGQVPPINYDDLEAYDWEGVVEWANTQLDVPKSEKLPDLPATREQFDSVFELREDSPTALDEIYQTTQTITINRKRALFASVPFAVSILDKGETPTFRKQHISRMEVVKSWIRANVVTPEETYRPSEARSALSYMKSYIDIAIDSLISERVISMGNRGRITPGRNFDITDHFLHTLGRKRHIEGTQLRRAGKFKIQTLDPTLQSEGKFDVKYNAEDGDILAIVNLAAERRVILKPRDPPADKFGLTDGGYLTRQMDKDKLRFAVEVHPAEGRYIYGNPIEKEIAAVPPPCPPRATNNGTAWIPERIPLWCDIHGGFIKLLWELSIAAVVGCVASRPGISAAGVASMIKPTMGAWEIELLLKWMTEIGVVRQEGHGCNGEAGWAAQEWWWMILC